MSAWKLVSGILSIILYGYIIDEAKAASLADAFAGTSSSVVGLIVALLIMSGGIVSICVRDARTKAGNIALIILFGLAALIAFTSAGYYENLYVYACWCLINVVLAIISLFQKKGYHRTPYYKTHQKNKN